MKRLIVVGVIFVFVVSASLFAMFYTKQSFEGMLELTEAARREPEIYSEEIARHWNARADVLCVFVRNASIDEISRLCSRLPAAAGVYGAEDKAEFEAVLLEIEEYVQQVYYGEIPRWYNIF